MSDRHLRSDESWLILHIAQYLVQSSSRNFAALANSRTCLVLGFDMFLSHPLHFIIY